MDFDIDGLGEAELIELHRRIVERIRLLQQARAALAMTRLHVGQRVAFRSSGGERVVGTITRCNRKSVTVVTRTGVRWSVSPGFLEPAPVEEDVSVVDGEIVAPARERAGLDGSAVQRRSPPP